MKNTDNFYKSLIPITIFMQISGFLPLIHVTDRNIKRVNYSWRSIRWFYSLFTLGSVFVESFCALLSMQNIKLNNFDTLFYRISSTFAALSFFKFSKDWPSIINFWNSQEFIFNQRYERVGKSLKYKIFLVTCIIFIPAYIEHGGIVNGRNRKIFIVKLCLSF